MANVFYQMKKGRTLGIILLVIGGLFIGLNYYMIYQAEFFFPKVLLAGFPLCSIGLAMMLFPGGEFPADVIIPRPPDMFKQASLQTKIIWIIFAVVGIIGGFWWCYQQGLLFNDF